MSEDPNEKPKRHESWMARQLKRLGNAAWECLIVPGMTKAARGLRDAYLAVEYRYPIHVAVIVAALYSAAWWYTPAPIWVSGASWWNVLVVAGSPVGAGLAAAIRVYYVLFVEEDRPFDDDRVANWEVLS